MIRWSAIKAKLGSWVAIKTILSLLRQAQWVVKNEKWGEVPDINRLSEFLKSDKSPVNKPLKKMEPLEVSKIIEALKGIVKSKYK